MTPVEAHSTWRGSTSARPERLAKLAAHFEGSMARPVGWQRFRRSAGWLRLNFGAAQHAGRKALALFRLAVAA